MFFNARFFLCLVDSLGLMNCLLRQGGITSLYQMVASANGGRLLLALRLIREFGLSCSI